MDKYMQPKFHSTTCVTNDLCFECEEMLMGIWVGKEDGDHLVDHPKATTRGRTGPNRPSIMLKMDMEGRIRVDDFNNPAFWLEFQLPKDYVIELAASFSKQ